MSGPVISIVIPCYRYAHLLEGAVKSVLNQSYKQAEIIIVNDGSPDNCREVAEGIIRSNPVFPITLLDLPNQGPASARNSGIEMSRGEWILPLDADDELEPHALATLINAALSQKDTNVVTCALRMFGAGDDRWEPDEFRVERLKSWNTFLYSSLFRKDLWKRAGGYSSVLPWGAEDWDFWLACAEVGISSIKLPQELLRYRVHSSGGRDSKANRHREAMLAAIKTRHPRLYSVDELVREHDCLKLMDRENLGEMERLARQFPSAHQPLLWCGLAHEGGGRLLDAVGCYQRSTELTPGSDWQPHWLLFQASAAAGLTEKAIASARVLVSEFPQMPWTPKLTQFLAARCQVSVP